jgi:hypothetical protein
MDDLDNRTYPFQEDMKFQRRTWLVERLGWIVMAVLVAAGLAGAFFHGPASYTQASSADRAIAVDYERFAHKTTRTHFVFRVKAPIGEEVLLRIGPSFPDTYDIDAMQPRPLRMHSGRQGLEWVFGSPGNGDLSLFVAGRAKRFGFMSAQVEVQGRGAARLVQIIYT